MVALPDLAGEMSADAESAARINARLDRLPACRPVWRLVVLLSLGAFFEYYDLFMTGYVAPGLVRSGILTSTTAGLFGTTGIASFIAALFSGLFVGTILFGFIADRFGRRKIFTVSMLWYAAATAVMAFQTDAFGLNLWRFIAGIGIGVELVTIDAYIAELMPKHLRGRAFALSQSIHFCAIPTVAFLAFALVPLAPLGFDGWRWVVLVGSSGAVAVWWIRRSIPESPRWLAQHGYVAEAERITADIEKRVEARMGAPLPVPLDSPMAAERGRFVEIWRRPYLKRTLMLIVFNIFQTVGYYGFANWVPTLLVERGITFTTSLGYTSIIALAAPFGPLIAMVVADKVERKWQIVGVAFAVAVFGLVFAQMRLGLTLVLMGVLLTLSNNVLSYAFHAYQAELFPTRFRTLAIGFVYSWSRLSAVFSAFAIAFFLGRFGAPGVFTLIAGSMAVVMVAIGFFGPRTRGLALEEIAR